MRHLEHQMAAPTGPCLPLKGASSNLALDLLGLEIVAK